MRLTFQDKKIIRCLSSNIPFTKKPFSKIAKRLHINQGTLLKKLKKYKKQGILRSIKPHLDYKLLGYRYNALVVCRIKNINKPFMKEKLKDIHNISHCVIRQASPAFDYNLYTMIHAKTKHDLNNTIRNFKNTFLVNNYKVFLTLKEFKKTTFQLYADKF